MQDQITQLQIDLAASAAATATATAALAGPPPAGAPNPASTAPTFAISPAVANLGTFFDLSSSKGAKLFKTGSEPLPRSFDFTDSSDIQVFLDMLKAKSKAQGWGRIFTVPVDTDGVVQHHSLLLDYGVIPFDSVNTDVLSYINSETKAAQDSFMLFQCIFASLETSFLKTITIDSDKYHVPDIRAPTDPIPCGALLLKIILMKAHVDTRATIAFIRLSLSSLDSKMMAFDSNISKFNDFVKAQLVSLSARGEGFIGSDLLMNVFKGYAAAQDADFALFIKRKRDSFDEGDDINLASFMDAAENKYKTRMISQQWSAPTKEQEQILALTARADKADLLNSQLRAGTPKKDKKAAKDKAKLDKTNKWAWKKVLPKEGEPVTKTVDGKSYHLKCAHHPDQWVCHTTEECSKNPANEGKKTWSEPKQRLKEAKIAAAALIDPEEEDSDEDPDSY